jgi:L-ascorbate metabolism protein UlaG (beta-lactamase superfamily)
MTAACARQVAGGKVMGNGDTETVGGIEIEAVPAYNIAHKRPNGQPFHPQGSGNGYVLTFGDTRVYVAGDTEDIPEMAALEDIACAFLPMNLPYTMSPEMAARAARAFEPCIVYPYHYGSTDPQQLVDLLAEDEIEVRVRDLA